MDDWGDPWADSSERNTDFRVKGGSGTVLAGFGDDAGWSECAGGDNTRAWGLSASDSEKRELEQEKEKDNVSLRYAAATAAEETSLHDVSAARIHTNTTAVDNQASAVLTMSQGSRFESSGDGNILSLESVPMALENIPSLEHSAVPHTNPGVVQDVVGLKFEELIAPAVKGHHEQTADSRVQPSPSEFMPEEQHLRQTPLSIPLPLIDQLFGSIRVAENLLEPKSALISTSSVRKAWYRLSRPETLRGFNSGDTDGNYVRVTWPKSGIRNHTINVVSKLVTEDLNHTKEEPLSGSTVLFNWNAANEPAEPVQEPPNLKDVSRYAVKATTHGRNRSLPATSFAAPEPPIVFSWSALPAEGSVWADYSLSEGPSAWPTSGQLSSIKDEQSQHKRAVTISGPTIQATGTSRSGLSFDFLKEPAGNCPVLSSAELPMLMTTDGNTPHQNDLPEKEDDDWGEMMQSSVSPGTTNDATTTSELTDTDVRELSRKRSPPVSKPRADSPHEVQLPESFLSELPRKTAIRTYLMNKVARIPSNSKPRPSNIVEHGMTENDETFVEAKSKGSMQTGISTENFTAGEIIPEDTQQLAVPFYPNKEKMDFEFPTAETNSRELPRLNNAVASMESVVKSVDFEAAQRPEISTTAEYASTENDEMLGAMLSSLPDLSYMLR
jgi:hypothetical protein